MVQRLCGPERISATQLAQEVGVHQSTLSRWLRAASEEVKRERRGKRVERTLQAREPRPVRPDDLPAREKLRLVKEAAELPQAELGEFLRRHGLHEVQLEAWRQKIEEAALDVLGKPKKSRARKSPEAKRIRELERELERKDKALAEVTALLVLKKNWMPSWGTRATARPRGTEDDPRAPGRGRPGRCPPVRSVEAPGPSSTAPDGNCVYGRKLRDLHSRLALRLRGLSKR